MKKYETLLQAQLAAYPDSLVLTDRQMFDALKSQMPDWVRDTKYEDWKWYEARHEINEWYAEDFYHEWRQLQIEQARAQWARNAFYYRSGDVDGFFYACGKREDGTYRHVGFRYGLEEPEYASGFDGMGYTPQGETA